MTAAPVLYGRSQEDGTMALYRIERGVERHVTTLLSASSISEALNYGWVVSNGWRDQHHQVVQIKDVKEIACHMLALAVAATGAAQ